MNSNPVNSSEFSISPLLEKSDKGDFILNFQSSATILSRILAYDPEFLQTKDRAFGAHGYLRRSKMCETLFILNDNKS